MSAKKVLIVGGVAGGMSAAARARRLSEDAEIIVFERSGYVSFANCGLPYYLGREIESESELILQTPEALKTRFNLDVRVLSEVVDIEPISKTITVKDLVRQETYQEKYDDLVLAVGASPLRPDIPGMDLAGLFSLRSIEDVQAIESWIEDKKPRNVVIAGGGFIGLEMAEQLSRRGLNVTLVDGSEQVLTPLDPEMACLVQAELLKHGVELVLQAPIKEFRPPLALTSSPKSCFVVAGEHFPIAADLVILGLGVRPEIALARKAGLRIGERGGIRVNERLETSVAGIWAVGDAIEVVQPVSGQSTRIALGGPANRQGRIVADNIFGGKATYRGTLGTAILRVFELTAGMTGLNETQLSAASIPFEAIHLHPSHHAGYFPGAARLNMKLLFHSRTGLILGAQVVGKEGVDKRIDVLATALKAGMTVRDLAELELAYAPPFGSAKDPINLIGMAAVNVLDGLLKQIQPGQLASLGDSVTLIDVRSSAERQAGFIPGSMNIPLNDLRKSVANIPAGKPVVVYCQSGQRSYYASRYLVQHGFVVKNLSGGYLTWKSLFGKESCTGGLALAPQAVPVPGL